MDRKEKLLLSNEQILRKIEERSLFFDKLPAVSQAMTIIALSSQLTTLAFINGPAAINEIRNDIKPAGPYSLSETEPGHKEPQEPVPAYGSDAIRLSDDLDGLLGTSGYAIFIDRERLSADYRPDDVIIVQQEDKTIDGEKHTSGTIYTADGVYTQDEKMELLTAAGIPLPNFESAVGTAGGENSLAEQAVSYSYAQINSGGTVLHNDEPSIVTVDRYHVEADGSVTPVSHNSVEAEIVNNAECDFSDQEYSTEVVLMYDQRDVICQALEEYAEILPDDYSVRLDAVDSKASKNDAAFHGSKTIQLTYPYVGRTEVESDDLRRTTLHEIFHAAYEYQVRAEPLLKVKLDIIHTGVLNSSDYRIPSSEELTGGLTPTLQKAEKVIGIITESEYIGPDSNSGHPWDNATEMLSSTAVVLAFYPHEFIENYEQLNDTQKHAIRDDVSATFELIERFDAPVESIIPQYDLIVEKLGL